MNETNTRYPRSVTHTLALRSEEVKPPVLIDEAKP